LTLLASAAPELACTWPNAPKSTFVNDRFIARHMMTDRMKPDDPSSAPAVMRTLFSSANPIATAASPAYAFSSEMTVGMSAPPIGMIISTPKVSESTTITGKSCHISGRNRSSRAAPAATPSSPRLTKFCPRYVIGRVGTISISLPAAMRLPVKVR
jgi:hypothetical protein